MISGDVIPSPPEEVGEAYQRWHWWCSVGV